MTKPSPIVFGLLCVAAIVAGCGPSQKEVCRQHQAQVWGAAKSYSLVERMKRDDLIDPTKLTGFFGDGIPCCPLGTNGYAPFKLADGPRCPHGGSGHGVIPTSEDIKEVIRNNPE
jgi:hypothetical protein